MDLLTMLGSVELLDGISPYELESIASLCQERTFQKGDVIATQGDPGDELFIICSGFVEVLRSSTSPESSPKTVVNLGQGQIFGEMALVDRGKRSATVRALSEKTVVQVLNRDDFDRLCDKNHHLGYIVMRNIAADLSFKLRHQLLAGR